MCYVFNAAGLYWDLNQFQSEVSFIVRKSLLSNHDGGKKINNVWTIPGFSRPQRGNTKWQGRSHGRKDANRLQNVGQTECQASFLRLRQSVNISKSANIFYYWTRNWKGKSFFYYFPNKCITMLNYKWFFLQFCITKILLSCYIIKQMFSVLATINMFNKTS